LTPQAAEFLAKAHKLLREAHTMLGVALNEAAGRTAYLSCFHVAQALIFEREGRVPKTHNGVQSEFLRLTKDDARVDHELRLLLSRNYDLKAIADYETGPDSEISAAQAAEAVESAGRFVNHFAGLLT
jgi:uncharacterized protein (UPF0332 family)